jgi:hypothetical protein
VFPEEFAMSESKGCSVVVVVMIAILTLVVGVVVGGGAMYFYYMQQPQLPVDVPTQGDQPTAQPATDDTAAPAQKQQPSPEDAVLYPLDQTLRIEGPLPQKEVTEQLLAKRFKLRKCYQNALEKDPDLKGEMSLQFTVAGSNGKVTAAVERHTNFPDEDVRDCILDEIKSWTFSENLESQSVVKFDILMLSMSQAVGGQ